MEVERYDPRTDKESLKELFTDFIQNKSYFKSNWNNFEYELNKRLLNLQYRNSMLMVKEGEKMVGWGTYTIFRDYLGIDRVLIHQILTRREDSFKKIGIHGCFNTASEGLCGGECLGGHRYALFPASKRNRIATKTWYFYHTFC